MPKKQSHYIQLDLIIILIAFMIVSILAIYNAQQLGQYPGQNFALKQGIYFGLGIGLIIILQFIDSDILYKSAVYLFAFVVFIVILLHFTPISFAEPVNGAKSWFNNKTPLITIQPSEFTKITLIIMLSMLIVKHREKFQTITIKNDLWLIAKLVATTLLPVAFIIKQPDLGTSLVFFFITGIVIILSGVNWKILSVLVVSGIAAAVAVVFLVVTFPQLAQDTIGIKPYQIERIMTWFDPTQQVEDDTFQIDRSLLTIGSGQLTGKGMNAAEVGLPEAHTDFIFSIVGESFGFVGAALVIFLFFLLLHRLVTLGMRSYETNPFGSYICFGFMGLILIHTLENIGMTIGLMPITGIPLLFISYGGSTTLSTFILYGIVYRIAVENSKQQDFLFK